jgi:RHS repeat-associated protein
VAGDVQWRVEYEPFGNVYDVRAGNREDQPLRFPGQELASTWEGPEESYNIFRWYRAGGGRYTQSDPIGVLGTLRVNQQPSPLPSLFLSHLGVDGLPVLLRHFDGPFFEQAPGVPSNLYAYVDGNPVLSVDPMGLEAVLCTVFREHKKPIASPYGSLPGNNCRFTGTCGGGPSGEIYKFDKSDPFIYRFIPPCKECPIACVFMWETSVGKLLTNPPLCYGKVPVDNKRGSPGSHGKGAGGGW